MTTRAYDTQLFAHAKTRIPGGVNSPVRAFAGVGGTPVFVKRAQGAYLYDTQDKAYIDYVGSWGPMLLGHAHPDILEAVTQAAQAGLSFGAPTLAESALADKICTFVPSVEMVRLTCSGTEATMSAIRLARGYTRRAKLVKFEGCYHGHSDSLLVKAGSGMLDIGAPSSLGVTQGTAQDTLTLPYNDIDALKTCFDTYGDAIACVIVEPIAGNMNMIVPSQAFHNTLRALCDASGAVLIFDEVMTGFRVAQGGAQAHFNITPDLTTFGKIIGAGLPVGAFGGRCEIMQCIAPLGGVYQAGTLAGNPLATAAGLAMFKCLEDASIYDDLSQKTAYLTKGLTERAHAHGHPFCTTHVGGMFGYYFADVLPASFAQVNAQDKTRFNRFFHAMLEAGIYLAPSMFEASFMSLAHTDADLDATLTAADQAFRRVNA